MSLASDSLLCPECGYDRRGLEISHPCPECGQVPDPQELIIWGRMPEYSVTADKRRYWALTLAAIGGVFVLTFFDHHLTYPWVAHISWAGVIFGATWWINSDRQHPKTGSAQLRIRPSGYSARYGFGPPAWKPWPRRVRARTTWSWLGRPQVALDTPRLGWLIVGRPLVFHPGASEDGDAETRARTACEAMQRFIRQQHG